MSLRELGFSEFFEAQLTPDERATCAPARVIEEHRKSYRVHDGERELMAELPKRMRHEAEGKGDLPAVGDWLVCRIRPGDDRAVIERMLARKSKFSRLAAGVDQKREQIVAANVDTVFLVFSMNRDLNARRLERYLALAWESGARPVVVLSKADLCAERDAVIGGLTGVLGEAPLLEVSALAGEGIDELRGYLGPGQTVALLGSSGVGKSTLVNRLFGSDVRTVQEIREVDDRGRHTTTSRELVMLPSGGLMVDTPGMRELGLWDAERGVNEAFDDVQAFAGDCRFADCTHRTEPRCGVQTALSEGKLERDRVESFLKLSSELAAKKQRDRERQYRKGRR